jgi:hypothetical protein
MSYPLFTKSWWKAASIRALRTALVIAIPYVAGSVAGDLPYVTIASAAGLGIVLSFLTSLAGLAELQDNQQNFYVAILTRVVKTVAQALVTAIGTAVLVTDVDWSAIAGLALTSGLGSLMLGLLTNLPEAAQPAAVATLNSTSYEFEGVSNTPQQVPVVGTVEVPVETVEADTEPEHRA